MDINFTGKKLIADVIFLTQRASGETSKIAARTIQRQTSRFLEKNPGDIKNAKAFERTCKKLCDCILKLQQIEQGSGEEIVVKRAALDHLLALSNEIEYGSAVSKSSIPAFVEKSNTVTLSAKFRRSA